MPSRYEDELWRELVDKHGDEPEGEHPPAPPWRPRGPWAAAGGAVLVAAAATGGVLAYSAISAPTPAYAVSRNHDGSVKIYLARTSAIRGLNARLKAMKVPAQAVLVAGGCPAPAALRAAALHARGRVSWTVRGQTVVRPPKTPARIHILLVRRGAHGMVSLSDVIGKSAPGAQVPPCVNHVQVAARAHGRAWQSVVVGPMTLTPGPDPCAPPPGAVGSTTGTTATTGQTTAAATTGTATTTGTNTYETTTSGQTTGTTSGPTTVVLRCCRFVVGGGGRGGATNGATTPTTGATTPTTGATGATTPTTAPVQVPAGGAACQRPRPPAVRVPASTATATTPAAQTSTNRQKSTRH